MTDNSTGQAVPDEGAASPRLPQTDTEIRDVWAYVERMLVHPDGIYDDMPMSRLRRDVDAFLRGYRTRTVATLGREHQGQPWRDARGRRWEWDDINGWVVDRMATYGGHTPDGHGPFSRAVQ